VKVDNAPPAPEVPSPKMDVAPVAIVPPRPVTSDATELMILPTARPSARACATPTAHALSTRASSSIAGAVGVGATAAAAARAAKGRAAKKRIVTCS
jgi:hypothetical protein